MLTIQQLEQDTDKVIELLKVKNFDGADIIKETIELNQNRKKTKTDADVLQAEMNLLSKEIGGLFQKGAIDEANKAKARTVDLKSEIKELQTRLANIEKQMHENLVQIPNIPHPSVPMGKDDTDNVFVRGNYPQEEKNTIGMLAHWDLAEKYDLIDFELGVKLTGAGFPVYKRKMAKFQRALIQFFLDEAVNNDYSELIPPLMVNEASGFGTGQLPDKEGQMYHVTEDNLYLVPTAEVPVTNVFRDVILNAKEMPIKSTAYTPCFRREAGSYGKDVRGLNRLHQFDKVEIVQVEHPDKSYETLDAMVAYVESLINKLELPYRLVKLCGGDLSFTSALTFDFEVYSKAQEKWLEVSSVSNFESYQATRLKLRYKEDGAKGTQFAHTLNGSALALPRIMAALLENNQTEEGILVPEALRPYTGFDILN
jgi:seryl-tRNA synthetase